MRGSPGHLFPFPYHVYWGVLQLAVLGTMARSVRLGTLLLAIGTGVYGCGVLAIAIEYGYTHLVASVTGHPLYDVVRTASYTVDPFVEEIAKILPLLFLAVHLRARRQRGFTDYLLLGAATGGGFGLLEALMRFGSRAGSAIHGPGGWLLPISLSSPVVPNPGVIFTSWLPAPVGSDSFLSLSSGADTNLHLAWSAVAGLGIGLLVRGRGRVRLIGPLLVLLVGWDHAAYNFHLLHTGSGALGDVLTPPFVAVEPLLWLWPLLALVGAVVLDLRRLDWSRAQAPSLRLRGEGSGLESLTALAGYARLGLPWTLLVVPRFVGLRRAALYAVEPGPAGGDEPLLAEVVAVRDQLDAAHSVAAWRRVGRVTVALPAGDRRLGPSLRRFGPLLVWMILLVPAFLYYVVGSTPVLAGIQGVLRRPGVFPVLLVLPAAVGLVLLGWQLLMSVRSLSSALRAPSGEAAARLQLRIGTALGAGGLDVLVLGSWLRGMSAQAQVLPTGHVLDAVSSLLLVAGLALVIGAFLFFPPSIGLVPVITSAGLAILVPSATMSGAFATTAGLGVGAIVLSQASGGSDGGAGSGRPSGSGSGQRISDLPQKPPAPRPEVTNWRLRNIVDDLWKGTRSGNRVGDGTTMDAVRNELRTGRPTEGVFHSEKAQQSINALNRWLRNQGPQASREDRLWAWRLRAELQKALRGQ